MQRYHRKADAVEAVRLDPLGAHKMALPKGVTGFAANAANRADQGCGFYLVTRIGRSEVLPGDWVVYGPHGSIRRLSPGEFEATYDPLTA